MEQSESKEPTPEQTYAILCAAIGERHFLIAKLSAEIAALTKKLDSMKSETPESAT